MGCACSLASSTACSYLALYGMRVCNTGSRLCILSLLTAEHCTKLLQTFAHYFVSLCYSLHTYILALYAYYYVLPCVRPAHLAQSPYFVYLYTYIHYSYICILPYIYYSCIYTLRTTKYLPAGICFVWSLRPHLKLCSVNCLVIHSCPSFFVGRGRAPLFLKSFFTPTRWHGRPPVAPLAARREWGTGHLGAR